MRPHSSPPLTTDTSLNIPSWRKRSGLQQHNNPLRETDDSDFLRESVKQLLNKRSDHSYPEIYDGVNSWSQTVDRLSKKVTSQRHDIYDLQHKLKLEAEKNRDLSKIIHADRKQYREVIAALTAKIEKLEYRRSPRRAQAELHSDSRSINGSTQLLPAMEGPKEVKHEALDQNNLITELTARLVGLQAECNRLVQARPKNPETIESQKPVQTPRSLKAASPSSNVYPLDVSTSPELRKIFDQNDELKAMIKAQAEELKLLKIKNGEVRHDTQSLKKSKASDQISPNSMKARGSRVLDHPPTIPDTHSTLNSIELTEMEDKFSEVGSQCSTASSIESSPQPPKQSIASLENSRAEPATVASSTSTPSLKKNSVFLNSAGNSLDKLRDRLDRNQLSRAEMKKLEETYLNLDQILKERPQLLENSRLLVEKLREDADLKHARLLSQIGAELC